MYNEFIDVVSVTGDDDNDTMKISLILTANINQSSIRDDMSREWRLI